VGSDPHHQSPENERYENALDETQKDIGDDFQRLTLLWKQDPCGDPDHHGNQNPVGEGYFF
jgi:hypothetical protein